MLFFLYVLGCLMFPWLHALLWVGLAIPLISLCDDKAVHLIGDYWAEPWYEARTRLVYLCGGARAGRGPVARNGYIHVAFLYLHKES